MLAGAVLALTAGLMFFHGTRTWTDNLRIVGKQRDATVAMQAMGRVLRATSISNTVSVTADRVVAANRCFRRHESDLLYDPDTATTGGEIVLLAGCVSGFLPVRTANGVSVTLTIRNEEGSLEVAGVWTFRN